MSGGPREIKWPGYATEENLTRLTPPQRVAGAVGPVIAEAVRI